MPDQYAYPGTNVLVNIPGYTDRDAWKAAETARVMFQLAELLSSPIEGAYDLAHLQAIHAHLVQGFYTWGGQLRVTETGPGGTGITHCRPQFIPAEAERIFTALAERDHLRGLDADAFSAGLAWAWGETTVLHPFRDINTRSQYVFFNQLARQAGWVIDWSQIDPYLFGYARTVAITSDERGLDALLRPALIPLAEVEADPELADRIHEAARTFFNPSTPRTFEVLDWELRQAIDHRQTLPSSREPGPASSATGTAAEVDYGPEIDLDAAAERLRRIMRRPGRPGLRPPNPGSSRLGPSEPISPPSSSRPEPPGISF